MKCVVWRILATIAAIAGYGIINSILYPVATVVSGQSAGRQFENGDNAYVGSMLTMESMRHVGIPAIILLIVLLAIWRVYLPAVVAWIRRIAAPAVCFLLVAGAGQHAQAFFDANDKTEAYTILPNESAFWIPDVGATKDNQAQFDSEQYLQSNKIAVKRFIIPHQKLSGSGGSWGFDGYVPSGRLVIVDRTPYSREWVAAHDRGTSSRNESFPCQSKEGLNITAGVSIGVSVSEANAAKFLYRFGVNPPQGNRNDPQVIFASVFYGRSLTQVMDDVGRKKVQTLVCNEIGSRDFNTANAEMVPMMDKIRKDASDYFGSAGITLDFIGWADTFTFDPDVQKAVNDRFVAATVASSLPTLQALADVKVKEGLGDGLRNKGLPQSLIAIPERLLGTLSSMFGKGDQPAAGK
jgi:hypothetical protein